MKRLALLFSLSFWFWLPLLANEGMWPPEQLLELSERLKALGLEMDAEKLSSLTEHPMNAVVSLGGCTASFVSPNGLIVTNHHCAYGSIQHNSTPEKNLLETGFLARSLEEELPAAPGSRVYVTVEFLDVTDALLDDLAPDLRGKALVNEIERRTKAMVAACEEEPDLRCRIASYYGGLRYSLVRQLEIRDVRLVYAPARGIGVFGGDIDNWMWPRHTGDFSFYRAYVGTDGRSTDSSPDNVPYRPRHYLRVSQEGVRQGELVLVAGYPGRTSRYRLSSEVEESFQWTYPRRIKTNQEWLEIIETASEDKPEAAIKYASLKAGLNNTLKNNQGMVEGFAKSDMLERKLVLEESLHEWLVSDPERLETYGDVVSDLKSALSSTRDNRDRDFYYAGALRSNLLGAANRIYRLAVEKQKRDLDREAGYQERDLERIAQSMKRLDRTFDPEVDQAVWKHFILQYHNRVPDEGRIAAFDEWFGLKPGQDAEGRVEKKLEEMYRKTRLGELDYRLSLLEARPWDLEENKDPFIRLAGRLLDFSMQLEAEEKEREGNLQVLRRRFMKALIAFLEERGQPVYPDANGTLRVTFGTLKGYSPRDAVEYLPFTTIRGILEKDTGVDPFQTPPAALDAMREGRFGHYAVDELGSVPVNFLSTCDTTGGNSGSPTLNGRGELVGLLFDGNYESMIADWDFIPEITRSIHVDMRYVLWVMEVVDQTRNLLEEMGIHPEAPSE